MTKIRLLLIIVNIMFIFTISSCNDNYNLQGGHIQINNNTKADVFMNIFINYASSNLVVDRIMVAIIPNNSSLLIHLDKDATVVISYDSNAKTKTVFVEGGKTFQVDL